MTCYSRPDAPFVGAARAKPGFNSMLLRVATLQQIFGLMAETAYERGNRKRTPRMAELKEQIRRVHKDAARDVRSRNSSKYI
ncbi:hypothetical protein Dda_6012 [Drechslerella dactyloides]|uniref:Uncharacterized protein n=1 Tax=Drechslerella dactyloides TaxID=74499 RepID=A0AAD6IUU9_DREDA|nr:hypothetical protein Dda_6012 [Drechslerella dactyloides]